MFICPCNGKCTSLKNVVETARTKKIHTPGQLVKEVTNGGKLNGNCSRCVKEWDGALLEAHGQEELRKTRWGRQFLKEEGLLEEAGTSDQDLRR